MSKSGIKAELRKFAPEAFVTDDKVRTNSKFVIIDATMTFNSFVSTRKDRDGKFVNKTGLELLTCILWPVNRHFWKNTTTNKQGSATEWCFLTFDVGRKVPIAKGVVQRERAEKKHVAPLLYSAAANNNQKPLITLDGVLPNWQQLCANPEAKAQAVRDIKRLIMETYKPPLDKFLVLDGDFGDSQEEVPIILYSSLKAEPSPLSPTNGVFSDLSDDIVLTTNISKMPTWPCTQGESDLRLFTITQYLLPSIEQDSSASNKILAYFNDTDIVCLSIFNALKSSAINRQKTIANLSKAFYSYWLDCLKRQDVIDVDDNNDDKMGQPPIVESLIFDTDMYLWAGDVLIKKESGDFVASNVGKRKKVAEDTRTAVEYISIKVLVQSLARCFAQATCSNPSVIEKFCNYRSHFAPVFDNQVTTKDTDLLAERWVFAFEQFLQSVAMSGYVSGGDFNNRYKNIVPERTLQTYLQSFARIGPLCFNLQQQLTANINVIQSPTEFCLQTNTIVECIENIINDRSIYLTPSQKSTLVFLEQQPKSQNQSTLVLQQPQNPNTLGILQQLPLTTELATEKDEGIYREIAWHKKNIRRNAKVEEIFVPIENYLALIFETYVVKYKYRKPISVKDAWKELRKHVDAHTLKSPKNRIPHWQEITYKYLRFQWQCHYWNFGHQFDFTALFEEHFGYDRRDPSQTLSKRNIKFSTIVPPDDDDDNDDDA